MRVLTLMVALVMSTTMMAQIKLDESRIVELKEIGSLNCKEGKTAFINFHSGKEKVYWTYKDESETSKAKYESITFYGTDDYDQLREWIFEHVGTGEKMEIEVGKAELYISFEADRVAITHQENGEEIGRHQISNELVHDLFAPASN